MQAITNMDRRRFISGALATAAALGVAGAAGSALASEKADTASAESSAATAPATTAPAGTGTVELHRGYAAVHGEKCFTQVVVAVSDGTIIGASVDDYQFMDNSAGTVTAVPNSDAGFGENYADAATQLASKSDNHEAYSAHMAEAAGATLDWLTSMEAIEAFAAGQTPDELLSIAEQGINGEIGIDTVSGCTLEDTFGYLNAIATVAADDTLVSSGSFDAAGGDMTLSRANIGAHGTKGFTDVVTLAQGGTIVAASIDDFQFMDATTDGLTPVPNSDAGFGENYAEGVALCSKSQNSEAYSAAMASKAGATQSWLASIEAIEAGVVGVPVVNTPGLDVDTISGSTLTSTTSYAAACGITAALGM
jgi:hypothetical protein